VVKERWKVEEVEEERGGGKEEEELREKAQLD
jgi:hypothetical protein